MLPLSAGMGLRGPHSATFLDQRPAVGWIEVHSENYFAAGGGDIQVLESVRADYPISLHGVGLSLGSSQGIDLQHLMKLKRLVARIEPAVVSEHLCWSAVAGQWFNDLLPLPYTIEALEIASRHVMQVQEALNHPLLIENVSSYLKTVDEDFTESEFLALLAKRTGCGLLLDINNVYVSALNHSMDAKVYLSDLDTNTIHEIHLAGFEEVDGLLIDTHSRPVAQEVWDLYDFALNLFGPKPTLIEWDQDLPPLDVLLNEVGCAQEKIQSMHEHIANESV